MTTSTLSGSVRTHLWRDAAIITGRTVRHWRARPGTFAVQLLFPVLIILMMGGLLGGAIAGSAGDYILFVIPGVLAFTMLFGVETTMIAVTTDAAKTVTDRFRSLPIAPGSVLLGRVLADMLTSVLEIIMITLAGLALGWRWENGLAAALLAYGLLLWLRFGLLWFGVWAGLKAGSPEAVTAAQLLAWPIGFLSTVFIDPATMPRWLGMIAEWNPLSATATAIRQLFTGVHVDGLTWAAQNALTTAVIAPLLLILVFAPLAIRTFQGLNR
ncbi:daunorubicin/doxorubicin resistance ABC transporter permease protein DrrB [Streptosporangium roseum]|uniref:ABC transporter permease n=1 Tax=Streptosporangium roseum TaxID=2001 RepID=UPI0030A2C8B2